MQIADVALQSNGVEIKAYVTDERGIDIRKISFIDCAHLKHNGQAVDVYHIHQQYRGRYEYLAVVREVSLDLLMN